MIRHIALSAIAAVFTFSAVPAAAQDIDLSPAVEATEATTEQTAQMPIRVNFDAPAIGEQMPAIRFQN